MGYLYAALAAAALAALLYWLLRKPPKPYEDEDDDSGGGGYSGSDSGSSQSSQAEYEERQRRERERRAKEEEERARKAEEKVKAILRSDNTMSKERLCQAASMVHNPLQDMSRDIEKVKEIARKVPENLLNLLYIAATQKELSLNLKTSNEREAVNYPTSDIEPNTIKDIAQISDIVPEQMILDDDAFYADLAQEKLLVMQPYENITKQKLLYILLDGSGSMKDLMQNGMMRHIWARGITVNLLEKAVAGEAKYFLRVFDNAPHNLALATNAEEANVLLDSILRSGFTDGGTNIRGAVEIAVSDIRTKGGEFSEAEILVITDGQDGSMDDTSNVINLLGDNIRMHSLLIGCESPSLQAVSTSYKVVN